MPRMNRRDFMTTVLMGVAAELGSTAAERAATHCGAESSVLEMASRAGAAEAMPQLDFVSALDAAAAIRDKKISSVELTRQIFERIDKYNPQLNCFAYEMREEALARAKQADEAQAKGKTLGALHGVPINVKESFGVAGRPDTWGIPAMKDAKAPTNSEAVRRLLEAGAVLTGGTNVPLELNDWQTYNEVYGTTNNPWDVKRTPGGSSGGTAASLAAGLAYLSIGSDIGGSIRVPAHFCGIYGHKPTLDLVDMEGHLPGGAWEAPGFSTLLAVGGPLARNAEDLLVALRILGGPAGYDAKAWKWTLPAPRHTTLRGFRVGYVIDDAYCPVTAEVKTALERAIAAVERAGATLKPGWPAGLKVEEMYQNYLFHLFAFGYSTAPREAQEAQRKRAAGQAIPGLASFADWQQQNFRRLGYRQHWQTYFADVDVFLSPLAFTTAFAHDHSEPTAKRVIATAEGPRPYFDLFRWIVPATLTGCPATAAPVGRGRPGLPIGIQIMGPFWEDATPIEFARLLAREIGGFVAPPGYGPA
jgi:amidase